MNPAGIAGMLPSHPSICLCAKCCGVSPYSQKLPPYLAYSPSSLSSPKFVNPSSYPKTKRSTHTKYPMASRFSLIASRARFMYDCTSSQWRHTEYESLNRRPKASQKNRSFCFSWDLNPGLQLRTRTSGLNVGRNRSFPLCNHPLLSTCYRRVDHYTTEAPVSISCHLNIYSSTIAPSFRTCASEPIH